MAPRLRMLTLYAVAAAENRLVAGTGNRSEAYVGYFTKWGDGAYDFNPIGDLTVTEVYEFLRYLNAPGCVIDKALPQPCLTVRRMKREMGNDLCGTGFLHLLGGTIAEDKKQIADRMHQKSEHKKRGSFFTPAARGWSAIKQANPPACADKTSINK